jgi:Ca2+-binding EF-hand superfamily protein
MRAGLFLCAACVAASLVAPVFAQVVASADYLARMDVDRDGRISLVEYQDWLSYAFDAMDADHDGVLSTAELPGGRGKPITREAHRAKLAAAFARQDANRDGVLNASELSAPPR